MTSGQLHAQLGIERLWARNVIQISAVLHYCLHMISPAISVPFSFSLRPLYVCVWMHECTYTQHVYAFPAEIYLSNAVVPYFSFYTARALSGSL